MSKQSVAFIHTSPSVIPMFKSLADELLTGVTVFNMVDESLLCDIIRDQCCPPKTARRLVNHVIEADDAGASHILVTCSSMGRAVEASRALVAATVLRIDEPMANQAVATGNRIGVIATLPSTLEPTAALIQSRALVAATVLRIDEPMANQAVATGSRIGVIATLPSTLEPTAALIQSRAAAENKSIQLTTTLVERAFDAVISGDGAKHDALVGAALRDLAKKVDVIVLAQASMARVVDSLAPHDKPIPILSSPRSAITHLADLLRNR